MAEQKNKEQVKRTNETNTILNTTLAKMLHTDILYYIENFFQEDDKLDKMLIRSLEKTAEDLRFYINERRS